MANSGNPYKKNNGKFGSASDHDYILYEPNKDKDIAENKRQAEERTREDEFDEEMKHDTIRDDYEPRRRTETPIRLLDDKKFQTLNRRLNTLENSSKFNANSLRKLQDEVEALYSETRDSRLNKMLSYIKGIWADLR